MKRCTCTAKSAMHFPASRDSWESEHGLLQYCERLCCLHQCGKGLNAGISEIVPVKAKCEKIGHDHN